MLIEISSKFVRKYKKLPNNIKEKVKLKESLFQANPFYYQLKTHKLSGEEKECWSFSIDCSYRIKFIFLEKYRKVLFLDVGTHDEVYD